MHHDGAPVYVYSFAYTVDAVNPGRAVHGLEPNLLFGNNYGPPTPHVLNAADLVIFDAMSTYWRRFAEDPSTTLATRLVPIGISCSASASV